MRPVITMAEWRAEFERVMRPPRKGDPGKTSEEIAREIGVQAHHVTRMLREAMAAGRLIVGRKPIQALDGRRCMSPCYQLKPEAKRAAKRR